MRKYNLISACLWLVLSLFICVGSIHIGIGGFRNPDAGLFPLLTAVLLGIFSLLLFFDSLLKPSDRAKEAQPFWTRETRWKNILLTLAALLVYALVVDKVGYLLATFAFILFLFRVIEPQRWPVAILGALVTALVSDAIFNFWLQTQLPDGVLFAWLKNIL
jgi:putative tricarboxylic transport membrane protein